MAELSAVECQRIDHINFLMDELHSTLNNIYEHLIDKETDVLKKEVNQCVRSLKSIIESVEDEA